MTLSDQQQFTVRAVGSLRLRGIAGSHWGRLYRPWAPMLAPPMMVFFPGLPEPRGMKATDLLCRQLCAAVGTVVLCAPYSAALPDAIEALEWSADHSSELGADSERLVVAGEGAGGGSAATAALYARDQNWPSLNRQVLIRPSMRIGTVASNLLYDTRPATASVNGVASATVVTVMTDSTAEDGVRYAARLRRAGIEVEELQYELNGLHRMPVDLGLSLHRNSKGQS